MPPEGQVFPLVFPNFILGLQTVRSGRPTPGADESSAMSGSVPHPPLSHMALGGEQGGPEVEETREKRSWKCSLT